MKVVYPPQEPTCSHNIPHLHIMYYLCYGPTIGYSAHITNTLVSIYFSVLAAFVGFLCLTGWGFLP
ncbi:hypothetical protein BGX38DRAFT_1208526 [Terfezia claveryi]|nr:hypothetical protein BGX38DRAFT_1208526 [Terfezia claveryi]